MRGVKRSADDVDMMSDASFSSESDDSNWTDITFPEKNGSVQHGLQLRFVSFHVQCRQNENIQYVFLRSILYSTGYKWTGKGIEESTRSSAKTQDQLEKSTCRGADRGADHGI